ncbi:MAG: sodium:proton antiporter [Pseudomonadota bacterium]|nr:sodium:proton antiporter [Pseudomonadota bacterium]
MPLPLTLMLLAGLLVVALLLQPLARRVHLPFALLLVVTGFAGSEIWVGLGYDLGLRAASFHDLIVYVFLPVLIFESAFKVDAKLLMRNLALILIIAIPMLLLSTAVTAALVYVGINHPVGFPWIAALLTGALLSATDPVAVVDLFKRLGVSERLTVLMEGESLFNDATAIVIFGIFLSLALNPGEEVTISDAAARFGLLFFGGTVVGLGVGLVFLLLVRRFGDPVEQGLLSLISAYGAFLTAEWLLHVSGVMAVLVTGLVMGRAVHEDSPEKPDGFVDRLWSLNAFAANALVFLLMGVTVTLPMFEERWLAMLIGIGGVLVARGAGLLSLLPLAGRLPGIEPIPLKVQTAMYWGGLRGAVTLALALSLPIELDYWWTIQSIAFGVVLFTLAVQAPTMPLLLRRLGLAGKG